MQEFIEEKISALQSFPQNEAHNNINSCQIIGNKSLGQRTICILGNIVPYPVDEISETAEK